MRRNRRLNLIIVLAAIAVGVGFSAKPWQVYREQQRATNVLVHEMNASENRQAELQKVEAERRSSIGQEELAREQGYLGPGEEPLTRKATDRD